MVIPKQRKLELRVLEALWVGGAMSMREVQESIPEDCRPSYETVRSIVYRLQSKKAIKRVRKVSTSQIFEAVVTRDTVHDVLIDDFADMFAGDLRQVFARLVHTGRLTLNDLNDAEKLAAQGMAARGLAAD